MEPGTSGQGSQKRGRGQALARPPFLPPVRTYPLADFDRASSLQVYPRLPRQKPIELAEELH